MKKKIKKYAAIALTATMIFGSTLTVFATEDGEDPGDTPETPAAETGVGEGEGSYEGGEMKYPTLSVTLPTIPEKTYDYIADPNGLIAATNNEKYQGATFEGDTGIFFLTDKDNKKYTATSAALKVTNENAQDIKVTVKLEQKTAGDTKIQYALSETFETGDKVNKIYLALTDGAEDNPKVSALSSNTAATLTATVAGVPGNYEPKYDSTTEKYGYKLKAEDDLTDWNECSFALTGAINKNATWGDDVTFPTIKVTWSYSDANAVDMAAISITNGTAAIRLVAGQNAVASKITSVTVDGTATTSYTVTGSGSIQVTGITGTGSHTVVIEHDGITYTGTVTAK